MTPRERFQRVELLFHAARELPPDLQAPYLATNCLDDPALLTEVLDLLAKDSEGLNFRNLVSEAAAGVVGELNRTGNELRSGLQLGPYSLVQWLAEGGMGSVWLARRQDEVFDQDFAIKFILPRYLTGDLQERFIRERRMLAQLAHPNIARIFDGGSTPSGTPYFVMEYVDGTPITQHCDTRNLSVPDRVKLWLDACDALSHAHQRGIIHRDVKPGNILVTSDGRVKVLDFGIARQKDTNGLTVTGARWGSPAYSAPEQLEELDVDERSDVYSLGIVLTELLLGRPSRTAAFEKTVPGTRPQPPRELRALLRRAVALEPPERYATVAEMAAAARNWLQQINLGPRDWLHRNGTTVAALFLAILLAAVGLAWWRMNPRTTSTDYRDLRWQNVTSLGNALWGALSPDHKSIVYASSDRSLWLQRIGTPGAIQIVSGDRVGVNTIYSMGIGEDDWVYYNTSDARLWRVPLLGGNPQLIREHIAGHHISWDGRKALYSTVPPEKPAVWVSNLDFSSPQPLPILPDAPDSTIRWGRDSRTVLWVHSDGKPGGKRWAMRTGIDHGRPEPVMEIQQFNRVIDLYDLPDGGWLVNGFDTGTAAFALWSVHGTAVTRLSNPMLEFKSFGRTNSRIVGAVATPNTSLIELDSLTRVVRDLSHGTALYRSVNCLPDGRLLAVLQSGGIYELWILSAEGVPEHLLLSSDHLIYNAIASPDGQEILFNWRQPGITLSLWRMSTAGGRPQQAISTYGIPAMAYSPDGKRFAYNQLRDGKYYTREVLRADPEKVLWETRSHDGAPIYSPDGTKILIHRKQFDVGETILRDIATGAETMAPRWLQNVDLWLDHFANRADIALSAEKIADGHAVSLIDPVGETRQILLQWHLPSPCYAPSISARPGTSKILLIRSCPTYDVISAELPVHEFTKE